MTAGAAVPATLSGLFQPMAIAMVTAWGLQPGYVSGSGAGKEYRYRFFNRVGVSRGHRADVLIDDEPSGQRNGGFEGAVVGWVNFAGG